MIRVANGWVLTDWHETKIFFLDFCGIIAPLAIAFNGLKLKKKIISRDKVKRGCAIRQETLFKIRPTCAIQLRSKRVRKYSGQTPFSKLNLTITLNVRGER